MATVSTSAPPTHRLLSRQIARCSGPGGVLDVERLLGLVGETYQDNDRDRERVDRANRLMVDELDVITRELERGVETLRQQNLRFEAALENMGQGLCMFDAAGGLIVCNRRFLELYGIPETEARPGLSLATLVERSRLEGVAGSESIQKMLSDHGAMVVGRRAGQIRHKLAEQRTVTVAHNPMVGGGHVDTFEDVTRELEAEAQMRHMAHHDALTGLPNRVLFRLRLAEAISEAQRNGNRAAVLCLDLDRFKDVNDLLGHAAGDQLLEQAVRRVRGLVRRSDTLARLGGDEFALIMPGIASLEEAAAVAARIVDRLSEPFHLEGQAVSIGVSIGIAEHAPDDPMDAETLLRSADLALYRAKADGRGTFCVFDPSMGAQLDTRKSLERDLRAALDQEQLEVHYQPQYSPDARVLTGVEALVRWTHPTRGTIGPDEFIPVAEETGMIHRLGLWVLRTACRDAIHWPGLRLAVNLSPWQFRQPDLAESIAGTLAEVGFPPERLEVEITEGALMQETDATFTTLRQLKALGIRIAMDDFGTGYSSLSYLRRFPFDKIKIDRSFIRDLESGDQAATIISAIVQLGHGLGMSAIAEGVETPGQAAMLRARGCDELQGYHLGRPVGAAAIDRLVSGVHQESDAA